MEPKKRYFTRRRFLMYLGVAGGTGALGLGYTFFEAGWYRVTHTSLALPRLPPGFSGKRIAFLSDFHHSDQTGLGYIQSIVKETNALRPDLILLGGDYVYGHPKFIRPCMQALAGLKAPLGCFAVLGNHDHWEGADVSRKALSDFGIMELQNSGVWLKEGDERLRIGGVGDLWEDTQDLERALGEADKTECGIILSHNPDFAENVTDPRVGLILSGHTHGGQVVFPVVGAPLVPSRFGQKYLYGLVRTAHTQVFVTRGLGTISPPVRFCCRPEIVLITLQHPLNP